MALTFRTTDNGQWGAGKGANLTPAEVDQNFWDLLQLIEAVELIEPNQIVNITVNGNQMTVHMADSSTFGPFTLPTASFVFRGQWQPLTNYDANDLVTAAQGLYFVNQDHLSDTDFNENAGNMQGPYYSFIMPFPTRASIGFAFPGKPGFGIAASSAMFNYRMDRQMFLPVDLEGSVAGLFVAPTAETVYQIYRNTTLLGSITFGAGSTTPVFDFDDNEQFEINDVLRILRPTSIDTTAFDLTITLQARLGTPTGS